MASTPLFHRAHYNIIAAQFRNMYRETLPGARERSSMDFLAQRVIEEMALRLAYRFQKDNERFDPLRFLDACSPDTSLYPLSELWDEWLAEREGSPERS